MCFFFGELSHTGSLSQTRLVLFATLFEVGARVPLVGVCTIQTFGNPMANLETSMHIDWIEMISAMTTIITMIIHTCWVQG